MADDLIALTSEMDRCWLEQRIRDLPSYVADDVAMVAPGGKQRIEGIDACIESYREFVSRCTVSRFDAFDHAVTERGPAAVVEYSWDMAWTEQGAHHEAKGREVLALARLERGWRVVWRTQLPA